MTDAPAHVSASLGSFQFSAFKPVTPVGRSFQGKVHQAAAREQDAAIAAGGAPGGEDRHASGPAGGVTQDPQ